MALSHITGVSVGLSRHGSTPTFARNKASRLSVPWRSCHGFRWPATYGMIRKNDAGNPYEVFWNQGLHLADLIAGEDIKLLKLCLA